MADSNSVAKATEAVKSIPELTDAVLLVIQTPVGFILTLIILLWLVLNRDFSNIFNLFERKENKRLEKLELYISNESVTDSKCLEVIKEQRDTYYFEVATQIYAEKNMRNALVSLHDLTSYKVTWTTIKNAMPYIKLISNSSIEIKEKVWHEKFAFWYNNIVSSAFVIGGVFSTLYIFLSPEINFIKILTLVAFMVFLFGFAIFIFAQNFSYFASTKISKELANIVGESET